MKRSYRIIGTLLAGIMLLGLAGCGKMNTGGEDTSFPYSWKEERKGTILLKLDGSKMQDGYHWSVTSTDETVLQVKVVKKEKKGQITYRIKPLKEGAAQVVFTREREVDSMADLASSESVDKGSEALAESGVPLTNGNDGSAQEADFNLQDYLIEDWSSGSGVAVAEGRMDEDVEEVSQDPSEAAEEALAVQAAAEQYEEYLNKFRAKDAVGEITFRFDAESTGKKGKLKLSFVLASTQEFKGVMQSEGDIKEYQLWEDADGTVKIRLKTMEEAWTSTWEGVYAMADDPGLPGIAVSRPELRDGKYIILEIEDEGMVEGAQCFTVKGFDKGTATIVFSNPAMEKKLLIEIEIAKNGEITVLSHRLAAPQG